jgi:flap endonuclease-1
MGMFYRTIRMVEHGIKPCYVFDGKPPDMKSGELKKRGELRVKNATVAEEALAAGKSFSYLKATKRTLRNIVEELLKLQKNIMPNVRNY